MAITVEIIEQKEFKVRVKGYDPVEVDEFLDEIADEIIALQDEIIALRQQLMQANAQIHRPQRAEVTPKAVVESPRPKVTQTIEKEQEETLRQILFNAQKISDETVADAHLRAEKIVDEAEKKANTALSSISEEKNAILKEVEDLKKAAKDYKDRFLRLVQEQKNVIDIETELFK